MAEFYDMLIPAQWALGFFQGGDFEKLRYLNDERFEGVDEETGQTRFFISLTGDFLFNLNRISHAQLAVYDRNIVRHWESVTRKRSHERPLHLKYFQYLTLLVTELYLDWYFHKREALRAELNTLLAAYKEAHPRETIDDFTEADLRKIAFWEATGAGKTLLMHVHILQYLEYAKDAGKSPDRIILLTPNEGLSMQHLDELRASSISAELMNETELFGSKGHEQVYVVDSVKLISDESNKKKGVKSFMASSFEGNNLVLVDEGHHGSTRDDGEHRKTRDQLCRDGFSFEYSATFGQVMQGGRATAALRALYVKSILFDYSYRNFHKDGYGKDAYILNLTDDDNPEQTFRYLCANVLLYYQQHYLYAKKPEVMQSFGIEKPLCVFVGNKVTTENSDVQRIVSFFADFLQKRAEVEVMIADLLRDEDILRSGTTNPLKGRFSPLAGRSATEVYTDILSKVFNTESSGALYVTRGTATGEITLSIGNAEPFGLITIGDPEKFVKLLDGDNRIVISTQAFRDEYFSHINSGSSKITYLVGAKKFIEGWSSWRVSTMGLLNCGQNEGTQIIQLFGRGVRLKGRNFSLKRSMREERAAYAHDAHLPYLETLQIFGIRANYMQTFRDYLEKEGVTTQDQVLTLYFPIKKTECHAKLTVPSVKAGYGLNQEKGFKTQKVILFEPPSDSSNKIKDIVVKYEDFAMVQMVSNHSGGGQSQTRPLTPVKLDKKAFPFFDWDGIYRDLVEEKGRRKYRNLMLSKDKLQHFAYERDDWYQLFTPSEDVEFSSFGKLKNIERIFKILLFLYAEKFYKTLQGLYEDEHREMSELRCIPTKDYCLEIENTEQGRIWEKRLKELLQIFSQKDILDSEVNRWLETTPRGFEVITFDKHLYTPLLYLDKKEQYPFTYNPLSLGAPSEVRFVKDLKEFYYSPAGETFFKDVDLYLMRNASNKLNGIGFAQAGNFYPDFLMWLVDKNSGKQYLTFIDPKGLRNIPFDSPKLNFSKEVKNLQKAINKESSEPIVLNSVILSDTVASDAIMRQHTVEEYAEKNIFFLEEGKDKYIPQLLAAARVEE